jgi:hypothetical protein
MATAQAPNPQLSGQVMFYRQPELLSKEMHGKLGVNVAPTRFAYAVNAHVSPLTVQEFAPASTCYPVIFVGQDYNPVAVFGLLENQNLFATAENGFDADAYVPAFIRRYPFVLAQPDAPLPEDQAGRLLVAIDRGYEYIGENAAYPFFDEKGEPTQYTQNCMQFCNDFESQARTTRQFVELMKELDLFDQRTTTYTPQNQDGTPAGEPQKLAEYFGINEDKLKQLPKDKLAELAANGALQQIYAHLNSLYCWDRLMSRHFARQAAEQAQPAANT